MPRFNTTIKQTADSRHGAAFQRGDWNFPKI